MKISLFVAERMILHVCCTFFCYCEFYTFQQDRALAHRSWESWAARTWNFGLHLAFSLTTQQSRYQSHRLQKMGNDAREGIQKEDSRYWRVAMLKNGSSWTSLSSTLLSYSGAESKRQTFWAQTVNKSLLTGLYYFVKTFLAQTFDAQRHERLQLHMCVCLSCAVT